jgi:hypothetical protein
MKRIIRNLFLILLASSVPMVMASGQDKKSEKKIKIVVDEGSGAKTVLDTVFTGTPLPEKIELKDGTVVYIGKPDMYIKNVTGGKKVIVTVDADAGAGPRKHIMIASAGDDLQDLEDEEGVVISHGKVIKKEGADSFSLILNDEKDMDTDATKYVVAKDGVVVTVESKDEEKAKEILKLIQDKLGVKSEEKK